MALLSDLVQYPSGDGIKLSASHHRCEPQLTERANKKTGDIRSVRQDSEVKLGSVAVEVMRARVSDLSRSASRSHLNFDPTAVPLTLRQGPAPIPPNPSQIVASNLKRALAAASVHRAGVTAGSLQAFAANANYALTHRAEEVAELLGLHSLDRAMAKIDHEWQAAWADHVRALDER